MQRLLCLIFLGLVSIHPVCGQTANLYYNNGTVNNAPTIDARNFFNEGTFNAPYSFPYTTYNTINYTNTGIMSASTAFVFETTPSQVGSSVRAGGFLNGNGARISAGIIEVNATNIVNRGQLSTPNNGRITVKGKNVDFSRSVATNQISPGVINDYWAVSSTGLGGSYSLAAASSPNHTVELLSGTGYSQRLKTVRAPDDPLIFTREKVFNVNTSFLQVVFLAPPTDPTIIPEMKFFGGGPFATVGVQWSNVTQHAESQSIVTNQWFFEDRLAVMNFNNVNLIASGSGTPTQPYPTYKPSNYQITTFYGWGGGPAETPVSDFPKIIEVASMDFTSWGAELRANQIQPITNNVPGASITNVAGRIEIFADEVLDLTATRLSAANYLSIRSTNHFVGSHRSFLNAPFIDLDLGTTNQTMYIDNVVPDDLPRFTGNVEVWSGIWTYNVKVGDEDFQTNYHVVIIDSSALSPTGAPIVHDMKVRSPNLIVNDILNVQQSLLLDSQSLTVGDEGELNILSQNIVWSQSLPILTSLTNFGTISANSLILSQNSLPNNPHGTPYNWLVNHGVITASGIIANANNLIHSGIIESLSGSVDLRFGTGIFGNDDGNQCEVFSTGDVSLSGNSLSITNSYLEARNKLRLSLTNALFDGGSTGNNYWYCENGFELLRKPITGDLLGTFIEARALPFREVAIRWAGEDRGPSTAGFLNNAALGWLFLDGGFASLYTFRPVGSQNALYVETIEFSQEMESFYVEMLSIDPNFTIYFASLNNPVLDPSEVQTKTGGRMKWIPFAGPRSSTMVNLRNGSGDIIGTISVNTLLRESESIDSDGDGVVNKFDTFPFDGPVLRTQVRENGDVQVDWNAAANTTYTLWQSHNFTNWEKVTEVTSGSSIGSVGVRIPAQTNVCTFKLSYSP